MKKVIMFSGMMMLILLASCGAKQVAEDTTVQTSTPVDNSVAVEVQEPVVLAPGFSEYDDSLLGEVENTVIFFHQESCGTCKTTEKSLIEEGVPAGLQVLKIDIDADSSTDLKKKYGVTMKHTFVQVDANGELVKKWNGSMNADDIMQQIGGETMMKKDEEVMDKGEEVMEKKDEEVMEKDESVSATAPESPVALAGTYADYDASLVGSTDNTVIFFHASWCPSCRTADAGMAAGTVPDGLTILKADFDSSTDLKKKYGVVGQHTFVQVDANGNEIKKWLGGNDVESVVERLK